MSQSTQVTNPTRDAIIAKLVAVNNGSDLATTISQEELSNVTIVTNDGVFNCHGALAVWLIQQLPEYEQAQLIRTRERAMFNQAHVCVDVGSVYDDKQLRFDSRAPGFTATYNNKVDVKMTTAGIIYKHFGARIVRPLTDNRQLSSADFDGVVDRIYEDFVLPIDANGQLIKPYGDSDKEPLFVDRTTLTHRVSGLNPSSFKPVTTADYDAAFEKALKLVEEYFMEAVRDALNVWLPSSQLVQKALDTREQVHPSGLIIKLDNFCDFASHLYALESQMKIDPIQCVVYPKNATEWSVTCVALCKGNRKARCYLLKNYADVKQEDVKAATGIADIVFVHPNKIMGGARSYEGIVKLAMTAIAV